MSSTGLSVGLLVVVAVSICAIGYFAYISVMNSTPDYQHSATMNVTSNTSSTVFNIFGIVLVIGAIMAIISLLSYFVSTPERYRKPGKVFQFLITTTTYFAWGLLSLVIFAVPTFLIWFMYQYTVVEGNTGSLVEVAKWIALIVVSYFGIAILGYIMKKKIFNKWIERRKEVQYEKNVNELPGVVK